jgi:hypothetical protein
MLPRARRKLGFWGSTRSGSWLGSGLGGKINTEVNPLRAEAGYLHGWYP